MSKLSQVIFPSNMTHSSFETMRARLAKNSLLYLPYGTYGNCDNSASITRKGASTFHSCGNIVITDKQPFYAPFDIAVDAEQYATYTRSITAPENGKVNTASIILPFQISVDADGKHTNDNTQGRAGDGMSFTVNTLNAQNCLGYPADNSGKPSDVETGVAYFSPYTGSTNKTQASAPYLVKTVNVSSIPNTSFTVTEYGANVNATTQATDGKYSGSTAQGKLNRATYDLTPYGTYAGAKLAQTGNYFYYAAQKFLCSQNLSPRFDNVYVMPFRAYFEYTRRGYGSRPNELAVAFGENPEITGTDDINANGYGNAISVATGTGEISVTAHRDVQVAVNATDGMTLSKFGMNAGETKTIRLVPGIYIVNGEKVAVKQQ